MKATGEVTLETEFEKVKKIDIDNWESVRGNFDFLLLYILNGESIYIIEGNFIILMI